MADRDSTQSTDEGLDGSARRERSLTALATRRPVAVLMLVLMVLTFGFISFRRLPRRLMPDIAYPSITVRTVYEGASPLEVEQRISKRLEEVLSQVRGLRRISSVSRAEASDIALEFGWGTVMSSATGEVRERVEQAVLPDEASRPTILRYDPSLDPILQVGIFKETPGGVPEDDLVELRLLAEDIVKTEQDWGDGFAALQVRGGLEREISIDVDEEKLTGYSLTMELISQRLQQENVNQASGILYDGDAQYVVRTVNEFADLEEIRNVILRRDGTVPVRLRQVATVRPGYADPEVLTRINGSPCVKLEFFKEADANLVEVAAKIRDRLLGSKRQLEQLEKYNRWVATRVTRDSDGEEPETGADVNRSAAETPEVAESATKEEPSSPVARPDFLQVNLPEGIQLEILSDQSRFIDRALGEVRTTALLGGLLAVLVLYIFLRDAWFTIAVGLAIPISIVASFIFFYLSGVSLNMMSLGGIALGVGMLVDTSVVVLESIFRCQEEGDEPRWAAIRGTQDVSGAVTASTLTTVSVFLPIVFVEGVAGQVFRDQSLAVVISLLASLVVSLYLLPTLVCHRPGSSNCTEASRAPTTSGAFGAYGVLRGRAQLGWRAFLRRGLAVRSLIVLPYLLAAVTIFALFVFQSALEILRLLLLAFLAIFVLLGRGLLRVFGFARGGVLGGVLGLFDRMFESVRVAYGRLLAASLSHPYTVVAMLLVVAVSAGFCATRLGSELIPEVHQGEFTAEIRLPIGTRLQRTDSVLRSLEARITAEKEALGIETLTSTIGVERDSIRAGDEGEHAARFLVRLERRGNPRETEERVKERLREILRTDAELSTWSFSHPVLFSFKTPIEIEVQGYHLEELRRVTQEIASRLETLPALKDVTGNMRRGYPEAHLRFDRELLSRYDLSVSQVGTALRAMVQGDVPSRFTEGDRKVGMRVRLAEGDRDSLEKLAGLELTPDSGRSVALRDVLLDYGGRIEVSEGPSEIRRIGNQRAGVVSANLTGMDLGGVISEVSDVIDSVSRPSKFSVGFGGQKAEMDLATGQLLQALLLAVFLVYVVMAIQFESLIEPLIVILAVPLAMLGVTPVLWALDVPLSIVVLIGVIVLAGIVVNNAIVLVSYVNQLVARGESLASAIVTAGHVRLRPILMTTATTVLGLLPLTGLFEGVPLIGGFFGVGDGVEVRAPLAITVITGLVSSTLLTLIAIPVLCSLLLKEKAPGSVNGGELRDA
jgi:HAE1 family hydrophobic/amphiphilic exporter-1